MEQRLDQNDIKQTEVPSGEVREITRSKYTKDMSI